LFFPLLLHLNRILPGEIKRREEIKRKRKRGRQSLSSLTNFVADKGMSGKEDREEGREESAVLACPRAEGGGTKGKKKEAVAAVYTRAANRRKQGGKKP